MKSDATAGLSQDPRYPGFQILPLSDLMGAEVIGLDLARPFDAGTKEAVHQAFLTYQLLVFRDQDLTKPQQIAFTEQFGTLERHTKFNKGADAFPLVHVVSNLNDAGKPSGKVKSTLWHSDKSFRPEPCMATILHTIVMPPDGGDTLFANMYAAYEALPESEKAFLKGKMVVHSWELSRENVGRVLSEDEKRDAPPNSHPLARVHPETGRTSLFIGMHASHIEGMSFEAGRAKILELEAHATKPEFQFRHHWRMGDLIMWDNRCLLHRADPNFDAAKFPRVLHRTCLRGTPTH
jgi:alpha-ketoglutarate-dependent 2,4-dichlorophenoxyacetate dioxygenase